MMNKMVNYTYQKLFLLAAFLICGSLANAQLPNEKFGKPSKQEWEFTGWDDALDADAVVLYKMMTVSYRLPSQLSIIGQENGDALPDDSPDFGTSQTYEDGIMVDYEFKLRTKILKPDGVGHANIDIVYYDRVDDQFMTPDELSDLKIKVFTKNSKGKVDKRTVNTSSFVRERVNDYYKVLHVVVPDVQAGSIIEYQYKITSFRHTFLYDWTFQECIPTLCARCDMEIPSFMQFRTDIPTNKYIQTSVKSGHQLYDVNRADLKKPKSCPTNRYKIIGSYIPPYDATGRSVAMFTSRFLPPSDQGPSLMPADRTHLKIQ